MPFNSPTRRPGFKPLPPPSAPRDVRRRRTAAIGLWAIRLFFLPHALVGIGLLVAMVFLPLWLLTGVDRAAHVTRVWATNSRGKTYCHLEYVDPDSKKLKQSSIVDAEYSRLSKLVPVADAPLAAVEEDPSAPAATVNVKTLRVGTYAYTDVVEAGTSGWRTVGFIGAFGSIWVTVVMIFGYTIYVKPVREKRLQRDGEASPGRITSKTTARGSKGRTRYVLKYTFTPTRRGIAERGDQEITAQQNVEKPQWDEVSEGDEVWVLHWPGMAKPSTLYGLGQFEPG